LESIVKREMFWNVFGTVWNDFHLKLILQLVLNVAWCLARCLARCYGCTVVRLYGCTLRIGANEKK
jgi:hypothetical protein